MTASGAVIPLTVADISRHDRFRSAELAAADAKAPDLDEMIETVLGERDRIERSLHAAEIAYGGTFDDREVRKCAVLRRAAELLGVMSQHKEEMKAVFQAKRPRERRRA